MKYVIVSGGVVSGLGKGITSSSIGLLLKQSGVRVTSIKIDPYLNTDAGTMSPYEHGEVYVLDDGGEADLDLGNYERFLDLTLTRQHNITTGKVYKEVIERERRGDYLGKTVQVVPHITDSIQQRIEVAAQVSVDGSGQMPEVCLVEVGGTVGDIESMIFLEALRQFRFKVGADNFCHVHVSLVPVVGAVGEQKTKPTQHGVRELRAAGLTPDIIICRSSKPLSRSVMSKISLFCMVPATHVLSVHDVSNIYKVPLLMLEQRVPALVMGCLRINKMPIDALPEWSRLSTVVDESTTVVRIGIVGKYTGLSDSYLSVTKSLFHAAIACDLKLDLVWVESTFLDEESKRTHRDKYDQAWTTLRSVDGVLVPGGFGDRGVEGKLLAVQYARENKKPFFGICLGMQVAVIEYARNVVGGDLVGARSEEFAKDADHKVVMFMPEVSTTHMGGTMRLGARVCKLAPGSLARQLYGKDEVTERHRHRFEINPAYTERITEAGLRFSGQDTEGVRMECAELDAATHPFFLSVQFHPEFNSRPLRPSPPFLGFVRASAGIFTRDDGNSRSSSRAPSPSTVPSVAETSGAK